MQTVQGQLVPVRNQERPSSFVGSVLGCARRALGPVATPAAAAVTLGLATLPGVAATGAGIDYQAICIEARDAGQINSDGTSLDCETPLHNFSGHESLNVVEATLVNTHTPQRNALVAKLSLCNIGYGQCEAKLSTATEGGKVTIDPAEVSAGINVNPKATNTSTAAPTPAPMTPPVDCVADPENPACR